jgi:hypothetical protein
MGHNPQLLLQAREQNVERQGKSGKFRLIRMHSLFRLNLTVKLSPLQEGGPRAQAPTLPSYPQCRRSSPQTPSPTGATANDFEIHESALHNWLKKAAIQDGVGPGTTEKEAAEPREAKDRIWLLQQESEILPGLGLRVDTKGAETDCQLDALQSTVNGVRPSESTQRNYNEHRYQRICNQRARDRLGRPLKQLTRTGFVDESSGF